MFCSASNPCTQVGARLPRCSVCFEDWIWLQLLECLSTLQNNGGCSRYARCLYLGNGQRNCSCRAGFIGDGTECRGNTFSVSHMTFSDFLPTLDPPTTSTHPLCFPFLHHWLEAPFPPCVLQEIQREPPNRLFSRMYSVSCVKISIFCFLKIMTKTAN